MVHGDTMSTLCSTWILVAFSHLRMQVRFSARLRNAASYSISLLMKLLFSFEEDHMYLLEMRFHGILCVINPLQNPLEWAYYPLTILLIQNLNSSEKKFLQELRNKYYISPSQIEWKICILRTTSQRKSSFRHQLYW